MSDDTKIHARWWTEEYPGFWQDRGELELDIENMAAGTRLLNAFAVYAVENFYFRNGTRFRISRKGSMQDYVVRAEKAWTISPART